MVREKLNQCINCDQPTEGKMYCSRDCYLLNKFHILEKHRYGKFRGPRTSTRAKHDAKRKCIMCGQEFIARIATHKICSDDCRMNKAWGCKPI